MFEDVGTVRLTSGRGRVELDPIFLETIEPGDYFVFLTPRGETPGVYVAIQDGRGFEVREQQGGTSTLDVSYRVTARRRGLASDHRLAGFPAFGRPAARPARARPVPFKLPPLPIRPKRPDLVRDPLRSIAPNDPRRTP
jgi:hypothetical protein